ncbi:MAG: hypothetical protein IPF73_14855 [Betaproteobacteria bacterium]|nr:hypothetical protein [Betaproteobacteria bacterium]
MVLVLSEQPVPSAAWKSHSDLMSHHRNAAPIVGVVFRLDAQREVDTAEYFVGQAPTSTVGDVRARVSMAGRPTPGRRRPLRRPRS